MNTDFNFNKKISETLSNFVCKPISEEILYDIKNSILDLFSKNKDISLDKIEFNVTSNYDYRKITISPKNLYTGLLFCDIAIPYSFIDSSDIYDSGDNVYSYDKQNGFQINEKSSLKISLQIKKE